MNVLFVCNGNVCRSPMAQALLNKKFKEYGIKGKVASAGFESWAINDPPDPHVVEVGQKNGVEITGKSSLFKVSDFDKYDKIFVMDTQNFRDVKDMARNQLDLQKIDYLMNVLEPGKNKTIPDPFQTGVYDCQYIFDLIDKATDRIVELAFIPEQS
jgi:protein-tyrosine phosphatase